jgi:arsenate reductase-like glutaredoxin family protein
MAKMKRKLRVTKSTSPTQRRLWLMFPPKLIKKPIVWEVGHKCLELDGKREDVKAAIAWLEKQGVNVEPVEISVVES